MTAEHTQTSLESIASQTRSRRALVGWMAAWLGIIALLVVVAIGLKRTQEGPVRAGQPAPDFTLTTFEGERIRLADLEGQIVVINFWASWCKPCEQEAADLQTAWEMYGPRGDVVFLGVDWTDTEPQAMAYLSRFNITYPNGPDLGTRISQSFRTSGIPETYFIARDGTLEHIKIGPFQSLAEITTILDAMVEP